MAVTSRFDLRDYLQISDDQIREQLRELSVRKRREAGVRQVPFLPVETLLSFGTAFRVDHRHYGGSTAHLAPTPVPELAHLFRRPPSSILAKMANLDGSRINGARNDMPVAASLSRDLTVYYEIYARIIFVARAIGLGADLLPDFLGITDESLSVHDDLLYGQADVPSWEIEVDSASEIGSMLKKDTGLSHAETECLLVTRVRIGQQRFARQVLDRYSCTCAFCGLSTTPLSLSDRYHLLIASHIKPWRTSIGDERTDPSNGIAACPTHDVAFDQGLISVADDLSIVRSPALTTAISRDERMEHNFGSAGLRDRLLVPTQAGGPSSDFLSWHRIHVLRAA